MAKNLQEGASQILSANLASSEPAFEDQWKGGQEDKIVLEEDNPNTVDAYLHFAYTGRLAVKTQEECDALDEAAFDKACAQEYLLLARLYCFGEKYQDVRLKNGVIDAYINRVQRRSPDGSEVFPGGKEVDILYKGTCPASPVRRLMVDMHVRHGSEQWLNHEINNAEFLLDLSKALFRSKKDGNGASEGQDSDEEDESEGEDESEDENEESSEVEDGGSDDEMDSTLRIISTLTTTSVKNDRSKR